MMTTTGGSDLTDTQFAECIGFEDSPETSREDDGQQPSCSTIVEKILETPEKVKVIYLCTFEKVSLAGSQSVATISCVIFNRKL